MITAWQDFYEQEQQRNENNPTAKISCSFNEKNCRPLVTILN